MNTTPLLRSFALLFSGTCLMISCSGGKKQEEVPVTQTAEAAPQASDENIGPPAINTEDLKINTFEVKDSISGKSLGWGYDLIFKGGGKVHQPIIPGIQGIHYFSTKEKAQKTAEYAAGKIRKFGGLVGINENEIDSLGVNK